jgi:hypothetical protein
VSLIGAGNKVVSTVSRVLFDLVIGVRCIIGLGWWCELRWVFLVNPGFAIEVGKAWKRPVHGCKTATSTCILTQMSLGTCAGIGGMC